MTRSRARALDRALALVCLPIVHVSLKMLGTRAARRLTRFIPPARVPDSDQQPIVDAVESVARALHVGNCLSRSLTGQALLRRHGLTSELRLGVRRVDGTFAAHAWLEHGGAVLNDEASVEERFVPFERSLWEDLTGWTRRAH